MKEICLSWSLVSSSACFSLTRSHTSHLLSMFPSENMSSFYPELRSPSSLLPHLPNLQSRIKPWDSSLIFYFDWTETMAAFSTCVCVRAHMCTIKHKYTEPFLTCHRIQSLFPWLSCFQFDFICDPPEESSVWILLVLLSPLRTETICANNVLGRMVSPQ